MKQEALRLWIEEGNVVISQLFFKHYAKLHITDQEAMLLLHIQSFQEEGITFPTHFELAERLGITMQDVSALVQSLMKRNLVSIESKTDANGVFHEMYSLLPLWEKIMYVTEHEVSEEGEQTIAEREGMLYQMFEQEFGRLLSPLESEMIGAWLDEDEHSVEVIEAALREAVLAQKLSLKYINAILNEWKRKNVKTLKDVEKAAYSYTAPTAQTKLTPSTNVPLYNWLED
ncbi:DnaD domain-containing protein [Savagea faecisuis]|uniref:DnaD domain-containing protein n=1 Tax=Savagea faecisuis TaxID=1274803 RepID=A0ABW3GTS9_9BACL